MINLINMGISRKKRTSLFRNQVEKEWSEYYWKFLLKHPDKLNWEWISCNPNITMDIIQKTPYKSWNWNGISRNPFNYEKELFIEKRMKEYLAAYRIQQIWNRVLSDPYYHIGFRKMNRDYDKLFTEDGSIKRTKITR